MRKLTTMLFLTVATVASADTYRGPQHYPQNTQKQTEARYQPRNQLTTVRLQPGRGRAVIQLPRTGAPIDYLELRAGRSGLTLDNVVVHFADGTAINSGDRGFVEPNEGRVINLPRGSAPAISLTATYRTTGYRRGAKLEVYGVRERGWTSDRSNYRDYRRRY